MPVPRHPGSGSFILPRYIAVDVRRMLRGQCAFQVAIDQRPRWMGCQVAAKAQVPFDLRVTGGKDVNVVRVACGGPFDEVPPARNAVFTSRRVPQRGT